jgi:hypothetical protein
LTEDVEEARDTRARQLFDDRRYKRSLAIAARLLSIEPRAGELDERRVGERLS